MLIFFTDSVVFYPQILRKSLIFKEQDIIKTELLSQQYDLVRVANLIQYLTDGEDQQMMINSSRGVKDGGYLLVVEEGRYMLWQRSGNDFNMVYCDDALRFRLSSSYGIYPGITSDGYFVLDNSKPAKKDPAMEAKTKRGGIDLTADKVPLEVKTGGDKKIASPRSDEINVGARNDTIGIQFNLDPTMLKQLQEAPGFVPVIINVQPVTDLRKFLGFNEKEGTSAGNIHV